MLGETTPGDIKQRMEVISAMALKAVLILLAYFLMVAFLGWSVNQAKTISRAVRLILRTRSRA